jgi:type II restriction enzyme
MGRNLLLFKLLGDKQCRRCQSRKVEEHPIIKLSRNETGGDFEYEISDLVIVSGGNEEAKNSWQKHLLNKPQNY